MEERSVNILASIEEPEKPIASLAPQKGPDFNPRKAQEETRSFLARALISLFSGTSLLIISLAFFTDFENRAKTKDFVTILLTSQGTLVGTALGFYFGDRG